MGAVLVGLLIATAFGSGDYVGGRASRSASTPAVLVVSQVCSVAGALVVALLVSAHVAPHDIAFGALAGVVNVVGLGLLYHGLAYNSAGVVAPIAAVVGAVVPVAWGLLQGERPSALVFAGIALAIAAGALAARESGPVSRPMVASGASQAVAAGVALGSSFVLFAETSERSGQWPVFAARSGALVVVGMAALWLAKTRTIRFPSGSARLLAVAAGLFDVAATVLLVVAVRRELIVVVAPVASLAPAFTVVLAWVIGGERLHRAQQVGLALALTGLVLIAAG
jgi:drug/metabolite transporter (DMT)-like permease